MEITLGTNHNKIPVGIPLDDLSKHTVIFGASGSGKTGELISIVEQVLEQDIPCLVIDIKGDLTNLLQAPFRDNLHTTLLTPGSNHGNTVDMFAKITDEKLSDSVIQCLLTMVDVDSSPASPYKAFLSTIIRNKFLNEDIELEELLNEILDPSIKILGMVDLNTAISPKMRKELALKLNNIIANPAFDLWRKGLTLDFDLLFKAPEDKTPLVICSVAHILEDGERSAALSSVLNEYLHWTLKQSGSKVLRSMIVVDECHGLMPPYPKNPVTKGPILSLLKQARAFGHGVILATQNPKDIDYKGLSNCNLWITGKLQTKNDRDRVIEGMLSVSTYDKATMHKKMGALQKREFMVAFNENMHIVRSLDTTTPLNGPLSTQDLLTIRKLGYYEVIECGDKRSMMADLLKKYRRTGLVGYLKQYVGME
jgi:DNA helicase HerA-like ATPase